MNVDLAGAFAGVSSAISVMDAYRQELFRIGRIPASIPLLHADAASGRRIWRGR